MIRVRDLQQLCALEKVYTRAYCGDAHAPCGSTQLIEAKEQRIELSELRGDLEKNCMIVFRQKLIRKKHTLKRRRL